MDVRLLDNLVKMEGPVQVISQLHHTIPASVMLSTQARIVQVIRRREAKIFKYSQE